MLTISSGHSAKYLTDEVATGRENYYTGAVAAGEPPGRWSGKGADALGLTGLVDTQDMTGLYEHFVDPRDEHFRDPSKWAEAATLGHTGRAYKSEEELYKAALDAEPNASPERRAELLLDAGKKARRNVPFLDATFSVQKSVTVLHTALEAQEVRARQAGEAAESGEARQRWETVAGSWAVQKDAVEEAIWAGNRAGLDYLAEHAGYSRIGHHGGAAGRVTDAHDWTVASFFQHDSRNHDPQLHIHNAILNRVQGSDGKWRTLDGRGVFAYRSAAAAVAERTTEEYLTRALGVRFATRPDGKAREVVGVDQSVLDLFSTRRRAVTRKTQQLAEEFEEKFGRAPIPLELDRLHRRATLATRKAKTHDGETRDQQLTRWDRQLRTEVAGGLTGVARQVLDVDGAQPAPARWSERAVVETALALVQSRKAAWSEPDLTRAISDALPDHLGITSGRELARLLDQLTSKALALAVPLDAARPGDDALPDDLRLANGQSAYWAPGQARYSTPEHVRSEQTLRAATAPRHAPALSTVAACGFTDELASMGVTLGADQAAAVCGMLTSGADVESLVGPAGTGKSFVVGMLAKAWQDPTLWGGQQRRVVGLAASQAATEVLSGEGLTARNIARWLGSQQRLAADSAVEDDQQWRLRAGDLVVVDESAMANTSDLARIHQHVSQAGAKLLVTGDHKQLAAVGAGGGMQLMAEAGASYELVEGRRFRHDWERAASLRLRTGDESVLDEYHKQGRLVSGGTAETAENAARTGWLADTLAGKDSMLIVGSNEQAARVSAALRRDLVHMGRVSEHGVPLGMQGTYAGVGDLVQARRNGWDLTGYEGNQRGPINRETYRVVATPEDGGLTVAPVVGRTLDGAEILGERLRLPAEYVREHVTLGYASTVHAAQGRTVDTCHAVVGASTNPQALYVGMSRGRVANTAYVITTTAYTRIGDPADTTGAAGLTVPAEPGDVTVQDDTMVRSPRAVLAGVFEQPDTLQSALATAEESAAEAGAVRTPAELLTDAIDLATAGRTAAWLDELVDAGHLTELDRVQLAAEDGEASLSRLLRRAEVAGHDPRQVLTDALAGRTLDGARQLTNVLHARISVAVELDPRGDRFADWTPQVDDPQWQQYLDTLAQTADARRQELAEQAAAECPQWAREAFGPLPDDDADRAQWLENVGAVAAHRELTGFDDPTTPIGTAPKAGQVEAYASWRSAWRALGRPVADNDERDMSDGQLRMRKRAYEREQNWAPRYVANELAGTRQAMARHQQNAELLAAEAQTTEDSEERARLEQEAANARALAEVLGTQVEALEGVDHARADWLARTSETRVRAERAEAELAARHASQDRAKDVEATAEEWLAAEDANRRAEDPHRGITDQTDLAEVADQRYRDEQEAADLHAADTPTAQDDVPLAEVPGPDIREVAAAEPRPEGEDAVRETTPERVAESTAHARRAINEFAARDAMEELHAAEEARALELARWHADDLAREAEAVASADTGIDYD